MTCLGNKLNHGHFFVKIFNFDYILDTNPNKKYQFEFQWKKIRSIILNSNYLNKLELIDTFYNLTY